MDVRSTSVRISVHAIARREAKRLIVWCDRSTRRASLGLGVVTTNTLCASKT